MSNLQDMIKMHYARDTQRAVEAELNWFAESYLKPANVTVYPPESSIRTFQDLLYKKPFDEMLPSYNMTPEAIAKLCVTRWVSSDHLMWMAAVLKSEQSNTFCCVLNAVNDVERLAARKLQSHQPNSLVFFVNVGISSGRVVLGTPTIRGNHWTLCQVHHDNKAIVYADTLGWQVPEGLLNKVNRFVNAVYREDATGYETVICHNPQFTVGGKHSCRSSCAMNYPVQTCGSVCGVISMVMAAVATHKPDLFLEMISR